jgi:hypothetical protein
VRQLKAAAVSHQITVTFIGDMLQFGAAARCG